MSKFVFSYHATQQAAKRFPNIDIHSELNDLVLLGGQCGDSKAFLTKSDVVIIVEEGKVISTVMSKNMYMANMAAKTNLDHSALLPSVSKASKKLKSPPLTYEEKRRIKAVNAENQRIKLQEITNQRQLEKEEREKKESAERKAQLRTILSPLAEKDFLEDVSTHKLPYETKKERHAKLKEMGFGNKAREIYESIYIEFYLGAKLRQ